MKRAPAFEELLSGVSDPASHTQVICICHSGRDGAQVGRTNRASHAATVELSPQGLAGRGERKGIGGRQDSASKWDAWVFSSLSQPWVERSQTIPLQKCKGQLFPNLYGNGLNDGQICPLKICLQPSVPAATYLVESPIRGENKWGAPCQTSHQRASGFVQPLRSSFMSNLVKKENVHIFPIKRSFFKKMHGFFS